MRVSHQRLQSQAKADHVLRSHSRSDWDWSFEWTIAFGPYVLRFVIHEAEQIEDSKRLTPGGRGVSSKYASNVRPSVNASNTHRHEMGSVRVPDRATRTLKRYCWP